jgi:hypothetical protein
VQEGLKQIHSEEVKYAQNGSLKKEDAQKAASTVHKTNPVFKSISVLDSGDRWKYHYVIQKADEESNLKKDNDGDKIVKIESFTQRPSKFRKETREAIPIIQGQEDRRHIVAWQTIHERLKLSINGKTVSKAASVLSKVGYSVEPLTIERIKEVGKAYLLNQFNDQENLWAGDAKENQDMGRRFGQAKRRLDKALRDGDRQSFDANIIILEELWHDPDQTGEKKGLKNMVEMTIKLLRREFRKKWG